jgi:hypothetical protein
MNVYRGQDPDKLRQRLADLIGRRDRMHAINQAYRKGRGRPGWDAGLDLTPAERQLVPDPTTREGRARLPYNPTLLRDMGISIRAIEEALEAQP